jgi:hypothetical protein
MKKALLLLAIGFASAPAMAQYAQSVLNSQLKGGERGTVMTEARQTIKNDVAHKTTGGPKEDWFGYVNSMYQQGISTGYYWQVYQDSTPVNSSGNNIFTHGIGITLDPTSEAFKGINISNPYPMFEINSTNAYTVDSFNMNLSYKRQAYNNYVDTLFVDIVNTADPLTFLLQFAPSAIGANVNSQDSIMRFGDATYDNVNNKLSDSIGSANKVTLTILLDAAFWADSTANGEHPINMALPTPLNVPAGEKVVAFAHFASGHTYPMNMSIDSVNHVRMFTYEIAGQDTYPVQYGKDYNSFLWASNEAMYGSSSTGDFWSYQGHKLLLPAFAYADPTGFGIPDMSFYLKCADCELTSVNDAVTNITGVVAYPNPANSSVNIRFTVKDNATATVNLMNTVGQVLKSVKSNNGQANFSTADIATGVYFYTVEANGQKITNRVVVSH